MQANKKTGVGNLLLFFLVLAAVGSLSLWLFKGKPKNWFAWGKPDPKTQALELIKSRYVDPISTDSLSGLSLDSLVGKLDPHSVYLDAIRLRAANDDLAGHFAGIGIEFSRIRDTVTVSYLMPDGPSLKAGIQTGDQLLFIGDRSLAGPQVTNDSVRAWVRGAVGSVAELSLRRKGKILKISVTRSTIATPAVAASFLLNDTTGYLFLTKFSEGSYRESAKAIDELKKKGMRSLILDLRSNGGGFLQEAVELADEFLAEDRLIVYTEGAHMKKRSYSCKRPGLFEKGSVTVLMNELSASASEVLAGALQDWCRATIVGRRSFGKGLVQEQFELSDAGALRLTVARYFTPLGRCIQRPYNGDKNFYLHQPFEDEGHSPTANQRKFMSPCGDTLYAAGGIQPDIMVPKMTRVLSENCQKILNDPEIIQWSYQYYRDRKNLFDTVSDLSRFARQPPKEDIKKFFSTQLRNIRVTGLTDSEWDMIGFEMMAQIGQFRSDRAGYIQIQQVQDPYLKAAFQTRKE